MNDTRLVQLDLLRGIAILGIGFANVPIAATTIEAALQFPNLAGWSTADRVTWSVLDIGIEGTMRAMLEFLFGASLLLMTTGPGKEHIGAADAFLRRNLWLMAFGAVNVFVLLFPGDILFTYGVAALLAFPFRRLSARSLLLVVMCWLVVLAMIGVARIVEHLPPAVALAPDQDFIAADAEARHAAPVQYAQFMWQLWLERARSLELWFQSIPEAFFAMLAGMALFKLGILQGDRRRRFYVALAVCAYTVGFAGRSIETFQHLTFLDTARLEWVTGETTRLLVAVGHVATLSLLIHLLHERISSSIAAVGRMALTLYLLQNLVMMWIVFPMFGFGLWGQVSWTEMAGIAVLFAIAQLLLADLWLRWRPRGPVEQLWRWVEQREPRVADGPALQMP